MPLPVTIVLISNEAPRNLLAEERIHELRQLKKISAHDVVVRSLSSPDPSINLKALLDLIDAHDPQRHLVLAFDIHYPGNSLGGIKSVFDPACAALAGRMLSDTTYKPHLHDLPTDLVLWYTMHLAEETSDSEAVRRCARDRGVINLQPSGVGDSKAKYIKAIIELAF